MPGGSSQGTLRILLASNNPIIILAEKQATKKDVKKLASVPLGSPEAILLTVSLLAHRYAIFLGYLDVER